MTDRDVSSWLVWGVYLFGIAFIMTALAVSLTNSRLGGWRQRIVGSRGTSFAIHIGSRSVRLLGAMMRTS